MFSTVQKLQILGAEETSVYSFDSTIARKLKVWFVDNNIPGIGKWHDYLKSQHDTTDPMSWSYIDVHGYEPWCTYDSCLLGQIYFGDDNVTINVDVYNGESLYGQRTDLKLSMKFVVSHDKFAEFTGARSISDEMIDRMAAQIYRDREDERVKEETYAIRMEILNKINND